MRLSIIPKHPHRGQRGRLILMATGLLAISPTLVAEQIHSRHVPPADTVENFSPKSFSKKLGLESDSVPLADTGENSLPPKRLGKEYGLASDSASLVDTQGNFLSPDRKGQEFGPAFDSVPLLETGQKSFPKFLDEELGPEDIESKFDFDSEEVPFAPKSNTDDLKDMAHNLRGHDNESTSSVGIIMQLKSFFSSFSTSLASIQHHYQVGDTKRAGAELKAVVGDAQSFIETNKDSKNTVAGIDNPSEAFQNSDVLGDIDSLVFQDVSDLVLGDLVNSEAFDELTDFSRDFTQILEEIDPSTLEKVATMKKKSPKVRSKYGHPKSKHTSNDPMTNPSFKIDPSQMGLDFQGIKKHAQSHRKTLSMPKISALLSVNDREAIMLKHRIRQEAMGEVCLPQCNMTDVTCNCKKLFDCVNKIDEYDLAVLTADGYIDTTPGSETYGAFSVSAKELNLFNLDQDIHQKLNNIKNLVRSSSSSNQEQCLTVLENFHSACDPNEESCSKANQQSFQLTIDKVCEAVNTPTKLKFEVIGDEFDGFADENNEAVCEPLSFDTCRDFTVQFERLYEARDSTGYPHPNPMRRNSDTVLDTNADNGAFFSNIQFPIGYNFVQQENSGLVVRTFEEPAFHGSETLHDRLFSLVNPYTNKALTVVGCSINTPLLMQDHDESLTSQQFKLNEHDELESAECSTKVIGLSGPDAFECFNGVKLVLQDKTGSPNDPKQKWKFYDYGIVNDACGLESGNLAITEIDDDSFNDISYLDRIHWSFINPFNGKALGVEDSIVCFETKDDLQSAVNFCASPTTQNDPDCNAVKLTYGWPMGTWCFEDTVTSMHELFRDKTDFNEDISEWDTSRIRTFNAMFRNAESFNRDLNEWNTTQVRDLTYMFRGARSFNGMIGNWDVSKVTSMRDMFMSAEAFNQDISSWDISSVTSMGSMFKWATSFEKSLCAWEDKFPYNATSDDIFKYSGCNYQSQPDSIEKGPFCAAFCVGGGWKSGGGFSASPISSLSVSFDPNEPESPIVWVTREDNGIYHRAGTSGVWTRVGGGLKQLSISYDPDADSYHTDGVDMRIYGVTYGGGVYHAGRDHDSWIKEPDDNLVQISIGCNPASTSTDCEIWGVNSKQKIFVQDLSGNYQSSMDEISGTLTQVSVAYRSQGTVIWGVQSDGHVFYRFGRDGSWIQISSSPNMQQVAVAYDMEGENFLVYGLSDGGSPYYRNSFEGGWTKVEGITLSYVSVAFDPYGTPMIWGVKNAGTGGGTMYRRHVLAERAFTSQRRDVEMNQGLRFHGDANNEYNLKSLQEPSSSEQFGARIDNRSPLPVLTQDTFHSFHITLQEFDGSSDQLFRISRDGEDGIFKIHSVKYPELVIGLAAADCTNNNDVVLMADGDQDYQKWKLEGGGSIESIHCDNVVLDMLDTSNGADGDLEQKLVAHKAKQKDGWSQRWSVKSSNVILMETSSSAKEDDSTQHLNQTWSTLYADPGFNLGLTPGFPGQIEMFMTVYPEIQKCLSSARDKNLARYTMGICDESMMLLVGSQISVGTLKAIADLVETKGSDRMPGYCCMDVATNSEFLGYDFDPMKTYGDENTPMECKNKGLWHLGVSDEACENAGGKWIRTPCVTLREAIDNRPSRFDLDNPLDGSCQDNMGRLETAFVSFLSDDGNGISDMSDHIYFQNKATAQDGCLKFCQSLPNYSLQTGMRSHGGSCICLYENDNLPPRHLLPSYAYVSPPKFALTTSNGMALGLRPRIDCNAANDLMVETQLTDVNNPRQQFEVTTDGRIVSVACPTKVLTAVQNEDESCTAGIALAVLSPYFNENNKTLLQRWIVDPEKGSITNQKCPNLAISSIKEKDVSMKSVYFALQNPRTQLAIGISGETCTNDMPLEMQEMLYGSPSQQFIYIETENKIVSLLCPDHAIVVPNSDCSSKDGLYLSSEVQNDDQNKWAFVDGAIQSVKCPNKFITISGALGGRVRAVVSSHEMLLKESSLPESPESSDNETSNTTSFTHATHTQTVEWDAAKPPVAGSAISLSDLNLERYQQWTQKHQFFEHLMGPFSLVNPLVGSAMTVNQDSSCSHGMPLSSEEDDYANPAQKFYLGQHGSIFSAVCPGLVLSADDNFNMTSSVTLKAFRLDDQNLKWVFANGKIESVLHNQSMVIVKDNDGSLSLQDKNNAGFGQISWKRINTRLLELGMGESEWKQDWSVSFVTPGYEGQAPSNYTQDGTDDPLEINSSPQPVKKTTRSPLSTISHVWQMFTEIGETDTVCYKTNPAFSASFENFARDLVIEDPSDEDQCRQVREDLGFDKDHPFDTEVVDKFREHLCDPFFTTNDHISGHDQESSGLNGPPTFEMVEYTPVEYEAVEYEEDEVFTTIDYEQFTMGDNDDVMTETDWPDRFVPTLGLGDLTGLFQDDGGASNQDALLELKVHVTNLQYALTAAEYLWGFVNKKFTANCKLFGDDKVVMGQTIPNFFRKACDSMNYAFIGVSYAVLFAVNIAEKAVAKDFNAATLGDNQVIYAYYYSRASYLNMKGHNEWETKALEALRVNMKEQHMQMRRQLQDRHKDIANHIGQDIADAQNSLGQAIVDSQNDINNGIIDSQNALGQGIVDAQNALGQSIVDSQNYITMQHNLLGAWLHTSLCEIYKALNGTCVSVIGPLQEDQSFIPMELHWPDGAPNVIERLDHVQTLLFLGESHDDGTQIDSNAANVLSTARVAQQISNNKGFNDKNEAMELKVDGIKGDVDAVKVKIHAMEGKIDAVEGKINAVEGKVDKVHDEMNELKGMLSDIMGMLTKE